MTRIKLYAEDTANNLLANKRKEIKDRVESESEDYIMNVGEAQYIEYLKSNFQMDFPVIHLDKTYIDRYETEVQERDFPSDFYKLNPYETHKKDVIVYHIPYEGNIHLLKYRPSTWNTNIGYEITIDIFTRTIKIEFINFYNIPEKTKLEFKNAQKRLFACYEYLKQEIEAYNRGLENLILTVLNERKQRIIRRGDFLASLGVPVKKRDNTPQTFAVPKPQLREKIIVKPVVHEKGFKAEPTLDNDTYQKILKVINDTGKNFERMPSVYSGKKEEDLRDHLIMMLDPNFQYGSASGETFNKTGKTDIQLRHDSSVVFIAECKFWGGEKTYFGTIDQLLGYLTWRDSKTAVIIFVRNKGFSTVLETVKEATKSHPSYIQEQPASDESWFNYIFSLPTDSNKEIKVAVQLFHLP